MQILCFFFPFRMLAVNFNSDFFPNWLHHIYITGTCTCNHQTVTQHHVYCCCFGKQRDEPVDKRKHLAQSFPLWGSSHSPSLHTKINKWSWHNIHQHTFFFFFLFYRNSYFGLLDRKHKHPTSKPTNQTNPYTVSKKTTFESNYSSLSWHSNGSGIP